MDFAFFSKYFGLYMALRLADRSLNLIQID